jgi:hypothetical protein
MVQTAYPFSSSPILDASQWSLMAQNWLGTGVLKGVLNELLLYADSTGMQVKVKSGQAWMKGHFFQSDAEVVLPIATADSTNPRIDRVVVRVDWVANTITLNVLQGTPSASPGAPAITQNSSRWEISLGYVYINPAASTIASSNVTDERPFAWPAVCNQHSVAIGIANQALTTATETQITLIPQGNSFPLDSYWSLSNWTCPAAGVYEINTSIMLTLPAGAAGTANLYVNGAFDQYLWSIQNATSIAQRVGSGSSAIKKLNAGDALKFYGYSSLAGGQIQGDKSRISIKRIG